MRTGAAPPFVWLNDDLVPLREAAISPLDRGFLYGDGLFETMRAQDGRLLSLGEHLRRLREGLAALRFEVVTDEDLWRGRLSELLGSNHLDTGCAVVKIAVSRGAQPGLGLPAAERPTVLATAAPYDPPSPSAYRNGWRLHAVSGAAAHALVHHKTLNYLFFLAARQEALDVGADEALIVDSASTVAETAAGSLLVLRDNVWVRPQSPFQLAGITVRTAARMLEDDGERVAVRPLSLDDLLDSQAAWVLNSLIGIMPVREVDGRPVARGDGAREERLRRRLLEA